MVAIQLFISMMISCTFFFLFNSLVSASEEHTITSGVLTARFTGNGTLASISADGFERTAALSSLQTIVDGCSLVNGSENRVTINVTTGALCVNRACVLPGEQIVDIKDCYEPSSTTANGSRSTLHWTSTLSSSSPDMFTVPIRRGFNFSRPTARVSERVWAAWDSAPTSDSTFLFATIPQDAAPSFVWWLGGKLTTPGDSCNSKGHWGHCKGAYAFEPNRLSVPLVATFPASTRDNSTEASGLALALHLDDFLSTELSLTSAVDTNASWAGLAFGYHLYRLGGPSTAPLRLRADVAAVADARSALGYVVGRHPTYFHPTVAEARTTVSGTGWYSRCGPGVGGCDAMATNATYAEALREIGFKWVWNNNFAEYFMGNFLPPVTNASQLYTSDAGVPISVDLLRARFRGFRTRGVTELPYFSVMEFGGGPPAKYAMRCPPWPTRTEQSTPPSTLPRLHDPPNPACRGPVSIQNCSAADKGSRLVWSVAPVAATRVQIRLLSTDGAPSLCLTAVHGSKLHQTNDELDVRACNATDTAQQWLWDHGAGDGAVIQTAMSANQIARRWSGRPGRCNSPPCCIDVNAHRSTNGQVLQGEACGSSTKWWARQEAPGSYDITIEAVNEAGYCMAFSPDFPSAPAPGPLPPSPAPAPPPQPWSDPNEYFANRSLHNANLRAASGECVYTPGWPNSFVMDPLDPQYLALLLEEARRHVAMLGDDFAGVSCDRGWPQLLNAHADDGVSYCGSAGTCRSLLYSQRMATREVSAVFHAAGKLVSYNPVQVPRVDLMEHYDAIFTEMSVASVPNVWLVAALSPQKPATMWTTKVPTDDQFATALLHGVFPMAPAPSGDHSLGLDGLSQFLKFGPMLRAMQGRVWRLEAAAVSATVTHPGWKGVDANLFETPDGALIAVLRLNPAAKSAATFPVSVSVRVGAAATRPHPVVEVLQVGRHAQWTPVAGGVGGDGSVVVSLESFLGFVRVSFGMEAV